MTNQTGNPDPAVSIENAAAALSRAKTLITTANVEDSRYCETELVAAIESLENLRLSLEAVVVPPSGEIRDSTRQIRREVSEFADLLRQAREFHAGWSALSDSGTAGYDAAGVPARIERDPTRVALKG